MNNSFRIPSRRPRAKRPKAPLPAWFKPLTWLTALLAAWCLVLLPACILQGQVQEQRFQDYQAALEAVDAMAEHDLSLRAELDSQEKSQAALWEWYDAWSETIGISQAMLIAEGTFQQGEYRACALILYELKQSYPYFPDGLGSLHFLEDMEYNYADRYRTMINTLTAQGYLLEDTDGTLILSESLAEAYNYYLRYGTWGPQESIQ